MSSARRPTIGLIGVVLLFAVSAAAKEVERTDYKISVPDDSTVDKPEADIDADHMTTINLPGDSAMTILVIDDKKLVGGAFDKMITGYKKTVKDGVVSSTDTFANPKAKQASAVTGRINGLKFTFEVGEIDGKQKAFIVVFTYLERKKAETIEEIQKALATFTIKE